VGIPAAVCFASSSCFLLMVYSDYHDGALFLGIPQCVVHLREREYGDGNASELTRDRANRHNIN
jgi:hypothetical protein